MAEALALGRKKSEVVPAPRGQVHLVDKLPVIHQKVGLEAVEVDPLAGDEAAVGPVGKRRERGAQMSSQAGRGKCPTHGSRPGGGASKPGPGGGGGQKEG